MKIFFKILPYAIAIVFIPFIAVFATNEITFDRRIELLAPVIFLFIFAIAPLFLWKLETNFRLILLPILFISVLILLYFYQQKYLLSAGLEFLRFASILPLYYIIGEAISFDLIFVGNPATNTFYLAVSAFLSNIIGGPAASLLMLKPFLRANQYRKKNIHLFVFYIVIVANASAFISPIANTHLYMAYMKGFTPENFIKIIPLWLVTVGFLLFIFFVIDALYIWKEPQKEFPSKKLADALHKAIKNEELPQSLVLKAIQYIERPTFRITGAYNFWLFPLALLVIIFTSGNDSQIPYREIILLILAIFSFIITPAFQNKKYVVTRLLDLIFLYSFAFFIIGIISRIIIEENPIYISNINQAWLITGISGFLDNVASSIIIFNPEFLSRSVLDPNSYFGDLVYSEKKFKNILSILAGISIMGGLTYTGNYVNIFIKDEATKMGIKVPGYFLYMIYSAPIIIAVSLVSYLFVIISPGV
jgi:Na+/H+ antiporter NhaD/arsenite permease-like protein